MIRTFALFSVFLVVLVQSNIFDDGEKTASENNGSENTELALSVNDQVMASDLIQEGQSSEVVVRAKRYYGCGCGCGCTTVAAVSAAPCGYGCCGCGYGK